jgi:hypothetical protein
MDRTEQQTFELKAFLSHRYKSPDVNLFFFDLLSEKAGVHFEVDPGSLATNVTRLERMIRGCDAFIGIYPLPSDPTQATKHSELVSTSRYFRLELDIALRARKPILIFFDQRYGDLFSLPEAARTVPFDPQEVTAKGGAPQRQRFRRAIADFFRFVRASMAAEVERPFVSPRVKFGLIVPTRGRGSSVYSEREIDIIRRVARKHQIQELQLPPEPSVLNGRMYRWLESLDWTIVDVGELAMKTGIVGYMHARPIPMVRLYKGAKSVDQVERRTTFRCLFGGVEVGYRKDIVFWRSETVLKRELAKRFQGIRSPIQRIATYTAAEEYFLRAALRNEAVFLSYSGKNQDVARQISAFLKRCFQEVFDYRDGSSITPGQPWLKEIFDKLARSALGVPLISADYLASGNCMHEAQEMIAQQDAGKMVVIPIKLTSDPIDLPTWMQNRQYLRLYQYADIETAVAKLVESFDRGVSST